MTSIKKIQKHLQARLAELENAFDKQQFELAEKIAIDLLQIMPEHHELYNYLSLVQSHMGRTDLSYKNQLTCLKLSPDNPKYHYNAAAYAFANNDLLRSMAHYQRCLHIQPDHADALWNYSEQLRLDGHIEMAIECLHKLISLGEDCYDKFYNRLASCYSQLEKYEAETDALHQKLLKDPDDKIGMWGYATYELSHERFETGFACYNRRFEISYLNNAYCYDFPYPLWDGVFKENQTILLHGEQGLGDEMMFVSPMNELLAEAKKFNAKFIIACKSPLVRLFTTSFPEVMVLAHSYDNPTDIPDGVAVDAQLPMGHILQRQRKSIADFDNNRRPYLIADQTRVEYYNQRIKIQGREAIDGKRRFRVGLMWGTVSTESVQRFVRFANRKSIPITMFANFVDVLDEVEFISLQNQERGSEVSLQPELQIVDLSLDQADFYDTAAIMKNLDLVISIDTSVAHLSGGLGIETWVPLPMRADWRYGLKRTTSYWYDKTYLFRQTKMDAWQYVLENIHAQLKKRVQSK